MKYKMEEEEYQSLREEMVERIKLMRHIKKVTNLMRRKINVKAK